VTEILKPSIAHLKGINDLLELSGLEKIASGMLKDLCLVAVSQDKVVGFIWAMVSRSKQMSYVDYFCVHPDHRGMLAARLIKSLILDASLAGVKRVMSIIPDNGSFDSLACFKLNCVVGLRPRRTRYHLFDSRLEDVGGLWVSQESRKKLKKQTHKLRRLGEQMNSRRAEDVKSKKS
jgi:hypothetical protein